MDPTNISPQITVANLSDSGETNPMKWVEDLCHVCGITNLLSVSFAASKGYTRWVHCPNGHNSTFNAEYLKRTPHHMQVPDGYETLVCPSCGTSWNIDKLYSGAKRPLGATFYCPNGCKIRFIKSSNPPPPPIPKTPEDIDYTKMIAYHDALSGIALLSPKSFSNKRLLKTAINIARNVLDLTKLKD